VAAGIRRLLKPGGLAVLTIDLFLDVAPFTSATLNKYGRNIDVRAFLESSCLTLSSGVREELCGFPEFDPDRIQRNLNAYFMGSYPGLVQCLVATNALRAALEPA
jgi:hypothetical protein